MAVGYTPVITHFADVQCAKSSLLQVHVKIFDQKDQIDILKSKFLTCKRYDLKEWWSKVTNSRYEKFIPWSGINKIDGHGFDPKLNDQVIIRIFNFNDGHRLHKIDEITGTNVDNDFRLDLEFINSNRCERLAIIEEKIEKYHNDLNIEIYEKEENFIAGESWLEGVGFSDEWSYTKETCEWEIDENMHERNSPKIRPGVL